MGLTDWYENSENVWELGRFLIEAGYLSNTDEFLSYIYNLKMYTHLWVFYKKEM